MLAFVLFLKSASAGIPAPVADAAHAPRQLIDGGLVHDKSFKRATPLAWIHTD